MKMKKYLMVIFAAVMAAGGCGAITATKEYVDKQSKAAGDALVATNKALVAAIEKVEKGAADALVATNKALVAVIDTKANADDVYAKTDTYSASEIDTKLADIDVTETDPVFTKWRTNTYYVSIGKGAQNTNKVSYAVEIGYGAKGMNPGSTAVGGKNVEASYYSSGYGVDAKAKGNYSLAIGASANSTAQYSSAVGYGAKATQERAVAIGTSCTASGTRGIAVGWSSSAYIDSVAIGGQAVATGKGGIKIGYYASSTKQANDYAVAIGYGSSAIANTGIAIGKSATVASGIGAVAIGASSQANYEGVAIGKSSLINAEGGIALKGKVQIGHNDAVTFGGYSQGANTFSIATADPSKFYFNATSSDGLGSRTLQSYFDEKLGVDDLVDVTNDVASLKAWAVGDSFKCVVTNLLVDGTLDDVAFDNLPALSFEYKSDGGVMKQAWSELTRWERFMGDYTNDIAAVKDSLEGKADRAWGFYDSHSGDFAPSNYTWISSPSIAVAGGLSWEKHVSSDSSIWVLTANGMSVQTAGNTNGVFTISDGSGEVMISIVKGDEQIVGAYQDGIDSTNVDGVVHWYISTVISDAADASAAPSLKCARTCWGDPTWYDGDDADCPWSVTWSNASGRWVAEVVAKGTEPLGFFQTYYKRGAKSKIRNEIPTELAGGLMIGGVEYELGTAVIDSKTVLTLTKKQ